MTALAVEISQRRPLPNDGPDRDLPYFTRPVLPAAEPVTQVLSVADMDTIMDSAKCSCAAGDDNPH